MFRKSLIKNWSCELGAESVIKKQTFDSILNYYKKNNETDDIFILKRDFQDKEGRSIIFRGINIAAKIPLTDPTLGKNSKVSFVNTPFPIEEADVHFTRLKYLGFNLLRWVVPWEAICPNDPNKYDHLYLEYLDNIVSKAKKYNFFILIDFHQDVWSRFTGGSGAPLWTLEKVGFKINNFEKTLGAITHKKKDRYPLGHLFWATNADRYAVKTMFTLFFGGNTFAPGFKVDGKNVQDFLQDNYIEAVCMCAKKLNRHEHIIGYDIINEPHLGYIGCKDLSKFHGLFRLGPSPLPLEGFALSEGVRQEVSIFEKKMFKLKCTHKMHFNPKGASIWKDNECVWRKFGVWGYDRSKKPILLRKNYFSSNKTNKDFYLPFIKKVCKELADINPKKINFIEHATGHPIPQIKKTAFKLGFSGHWYDAFVISMRKVWNFISVDIVTHKIKLNLPYFIQKNLSMQIFRLIRKVKKNLGDIPFLLSEFGIPFDLNRKKAYADGDFLKQREGLERSFKAVEKTMVSSIIWNYTSLNSNEKGDLWNNEDFSIFSMDQQRDPTNPYSGIRGKEAIVRPYVIKTPGVLTGYSFKRKEGFFSCTFTHKKTIKAPMEIFLPNLHYGNGFEIETSEGKHEVNYLDQKVLFYPKSNSCKYHKINIYKKYPIKKRQNRSWSFFN